MRDSPFKIVLSEFIGKGQAKYVNKTVKNDSFFNFFAPPEGTVKVMRSSCFIYSPLNTPGPGYFVSRISDVPFIVVPYQAHISEERVSPNGDRTDAIRLCIKLMLMCEWNFLERHFVVM